MISNNIIYFAFGSLITVKNKNGQAHPLYINPCKISFLIQWYLALEFGVIVFHDDMDMDSVKG